MASVGVDCRGPWGSVAGATGSERAAIACGPARTQVRREARAAAHVQLRDVHGILCTSNHLINDHGCWRVIMCSVLLLKPETFD